MTDEGEPEPDQRVNAEERPTRMRTVVIKRSAVSPPEAGNLKSRSPGFHLVSDMGCHRGLPEEPRGKTRSSDRLLGVNARLILVLVDDSIE